MLGWTTRNTHLKHDNYYTWTWWTCQFPWPSPVRPVLPPRWTPQGWQRESPTSPFNAEISVPRYAVLRGVLQNRHHAQRQENLCNALYFRRASCLFRNSLKSWITARNTRDVPAHPLRVWKRRWPGLSGILLASRLLVQRFPPSFPSELISAEANFSFTDLRSTANATNFYFLTNSATIQ